MIQIMKKKQKARRINKDYNRNWYEEFTKNNCRQNINNKRNN